MQRDFFAVLGLAPGRYEPEEIARRFLAERARWVAALNSPESYAQARQRLDELHLAYATLRDPGAQAEYLRTQRDGPGPVDELRRLIAASLEDGLLRYSRRQAILEAARGLGLSDFHAHLLIAQVQFGEGPDLLDSTSSRRTADGRSARPWARMAAVGVLALAMFLAMVRWLAA